MRSKALALLRSAVGSATADFRPNQWEAIQQLVNGERLLLVERTGWGKSSVYFLATRLLRDNGAGCALLISPLISLMRNQLERARCIGVHAETINCANVSDWSRIHGALLRDAVDVLLISPERLAAERFATEYLLPIAKRVGLLVVDEAHCISDWGHDFRPDYRRIVQILRVLPRDVPVLATTATANERVVADVVDQLGPHLSVIRGPLARPSLRLQKIVLADKAVRMAWIAEQLPRLPGTGIIYVLTRRDAEVLAEWLQSRGFAVKAYHADLPATEREQVEQELLSNLLKAVVATVALGMGFDKPDVGFVIHFQRPPSVIHYYQQVGRAGRALDRAYGILLAGAEDDEIAERFADTGFPLEYQVQAVLDALAAADEGLSEAELRQELNIPRGTIEKVLKFLLLESPSPIECIHQRYRRMRIEWCMPWERIDEIIELRRMEQQRIREYVGTRGCLMEFLTRELNDPSAEACGRCANCRHKGLPTTFSADLAQQASTFLDSTPLFIEPRCRWPQGQHFEKYHGNIRVEFRCERGRALCRWGESGWAQLVKEGKQHAGRFCDRLMEASIALIREQWNPVPAPRWVTCVPSRRHRCLVPDLAQRLAVRLDVPFVECIYKVRDTEPQKTRCTSIQQVHNLEGVFEIDRDQVMSGAVLLVDDMVDSRWTFAVLGLKLRQAGTGPVFPFALADTSCSARDWGTDDVRIERRHSGHVIARGPAWRTA